MDCLVSQLNSPRPHPLTHELIALHVADSEISTPDSEPIPGCSGLSNRVQITPPEPETSSDSDTSAAGYSTTDSHHREIDEDYMSDIFSADSKKYNYLDPNFFPELYRN